MNAIVNKKLCISCPPFAVFEGWDNQVRTESPVPQFLPRLRVAMTIPNFVLS
jgi:hypothetical protein